VKEFEFILTPLAITEDRNLILDFSHYLNIDEHVIMYKYPTFKADIAGFAKPFSYFVSKFYFLSQ